MTTIEKAAKAIAVEWYCETGHSDAGAVAAAESQWKGFESLARAALQAIREIDPDIMLRVQWGRVPDRIQAYWGDTITAILEEKPE